jgi:3-hydroxyacyl-CoA dehydrogenase
MFLMARLVRFRVLDGIAVVTLDAPPVNALSGPLRAGLWEVLTRVDANDDIKAAVILAAGSMFSAGADIREFDGPDHKPSLPQLCDRIESCTKPVVAALHGQALGGGLKSRWRPIAAGRTRMRGLACRKYPWALSPARAAPKGYRV